MEITSVYLILSATLNIYPNKCQFFRYENIHLSCVASGNSSNWTVRRNTSSETLQPCKGGFGDPDESCILSDVYPSDSGLYWCESEQGKRSNTVNITVAAGAVILESPAIPVSEGDNVTLRCSYKERNDKTSTSNFNAIFYKNNIYFGEEPKGKMILNVSKYDEGFYKCQHPTKGESPKSFLAVRARVQPVSGSVPPPLMSLPKLVCTVLLFFLYTVVFMLCIYTYRKWAQARADAKSIALEDLEL
ncbi:uncharacterized protein LOC120746813 [Simochromis diagramma]|uniref:uncharacterized protein LOC120746813 n=1 Tax=Simochromis diagramma TaxID=43689 RepID=UPI001A7EF2D5|nr:uncharacterized protein LOC120746813 [Simochromis diagramma]